jgi:hypothetical protein
MKKTTLFRSLLGMALVALSPAITLKAQTFSPYPAGDDASSSLGEFRLLVDSAFIDITDAALKGSILNTTETWPGSGLLIYDGGAFSSPVLYDAATLVGRSDAFVSGTSPYEGGTIAGRAPGRTIINDSQLTLLPSWPDASNRVYEVHTFLKSLYLSDAVTTHLGISVKAGMDAPTRPVSAGEVEAYTTNSDFPARSFFNVYVQVDIPAAGALPAVQLVNVDPLLVENSVIYGFPPRAFYIHQNTNSVSVYFNTDVTISNTNGSVTIPRGTLFGQLSLAGHGMSYGEFDIPSFETEVETTAATSTMPLNGNPYKSVVIQDFAPNYNAVRVPQPAQYHLTNNVFGFTVLNVDVHSTNYVQARTSLSLGNWQNISTNIAVSNSFSFLDPQTGSSQQRFFRVMVKP